VYFLNAAMDPLQFLSPDGRDPADAATRGFSVINYVGGHTSFSYAVFASPADPPSVVEARNTVHSFMVQAIAIAAAAAATTAAATTSYLRQHLSGDDSSSNTAIIAGSVAGAVVVAVVVVVTAVLTRAKKRTGRLSFINKPWPRSHAPSTTSSAMTGITGVFDEAGSPTASNSAAGGRGAAYQKS
jgi:hypothetical protein